MALISTTHTQMALILNVSFIFLTLQLFLIIYPPFFPHANASSSEFSTSVLNVTEALHQAQQLLSLKPKTLQPCSSFSHHNINDYRSLVFAQLVHDSARLTKLFSKLTHLNNSSPYQPKIKLPMKPSLSVPVTSGMSAGSGEYFLRMGVGQPRKSFSMILDTGSDLTWLQCNPCFSCYKQTDPLFNPSTSSSYSPITCHAKHCHQLQTSSCTNHHCQYQVVYGDLSYSNGTLVTETVSLGKTGSVNRLAIGCGHVNRGLFAGAAGILGLGRGPLSFISQIKAASFSYCLVNRDTNKSSTLEFNSPRPVDSVTTRLVKNPRLGTFYYAAFAGVSVGGKRVPVPKSTFMIERSSGRGGIVVDSGTVITRLETRAYEAVRDAFVAMTLDLARAEGFLIMDTCYDLSSVKTVRLPTVSFEMSDGRSWMLPVNGYMIPVDTNGIFCFAFAPSPLPLSILGNVQQQGTRVSFDLVNSVVGFSSFKC